MFLGSCLFLCSGCCSGCSSPPYVFINSSGSASDSCLRLESPNKFSNEPSTPVPVIAIVNVMAIKAIIK
ncbi:hypothetical protein DERP_006091 [Dermatophagoides pteronyssinus]|uniref:Secreted protein n=1 Tax=Dermatophagoides pteronyssinus TaxID=6956 RepID=A0ABQ8JS98_DERPT|nr:hypothetical protein DERP_006091 [Dermatophagoides pteronyssinus]